MLFILVCVYPCLCFLFFSVLLILVCRCLSLFVVFNSCLSFFILFFSFFILVCRCLSFIVVVCRCSSLSVVVLLYSKEAERCRLPRCVFLRVITMINLTPYGGEACVGGGAGGGRLKRMTSKRCISGRRVFYLHAYRFSFNFS